jgi:hypothetical protein
VIEEWVKELRNAQREQLEIDPETTVEIEPERFERLATAMEEAARIWRAILERRVSPAGRTP